MTKGEIIESVLKEVEGRLLEDDESYEEAAVRHLEATLGGEDPSTNIRTCDDFGHLNVECCDICHIFSLPFEMELKNLEGGGNAWICCALGRVLNPVEQARIEQSLVHKMVEHMLGEMSKAE